MNDETLVLNLKIRPVESPDNPAVKRLVQETLTEFGLDRAGTAYFDPELSHMAEYYQGSEHAQYWVLSNGRQVFGGVGIFPIDTAASPSICEVQKFYLNPDLRGRGWGAKLLKHALDYAGKYYQFAYLDTRSEMSDAIGLYKKFGFERLEAAPAHATHHFMDHWFLKEL